MKSPATKIITNIRINDGNADDDEANDWMWHMTNICVLWLEPSTNQPNCRFHITIYHYYNIVLIQFSTFCGVEFYICFHHHHHHVWHRICMVRTKISMCRRGIRSSQTYEIAWRNLIKVCKCAYLPKSKCNLFPTTEKKTKTSHIIAIIYVIGFLNVQYDLTKKTCPTPSHSTESWQHILISICMKITILGSMNKWPSAWHAHSSGFYEFLRPTRKHHHPCTQSVRLNGKSSSNRKKLN